MLREKSAHSWLETVSKLVHNRSQRPPSLVCRLQGERLENRALLTTAVLPAAPAPGITLAEYLAQDHPMGPIAPPQPAATTATTDSSSVDSLSSGLSTTSIDQWFAAAEGEGGAAGTSSGSGGGAGSGSGAIAGSGSGSTAASGSGGGAGSGSGSGGASGSGSSTSGDPTISSAQLIDDNGVITVTGIVGDNTGLDGLTMTLSGGDGTITINDDGTFNVNLTSTDGTGEFTLTVTDVDGNSTTYTFTYAT